MNKILLACLLLVCIFGAKAQSFRTPTFTGNIADFNAAERFAAAANNTTYAITFDATYIYFGAFRTSGSFGSSDNFSIYIDTDPRNTLASGNGTTAGRLYNNFTPTLPFNADYTSITEQFYTDPINRFNGSWASTGVTPTVSTGSTWREIRIALADLGNPASVYVTMWMGYNGGIFSNAPGTSNEGTAATRTITGFFGSFPVYKSGITPISFRTQNTSAANGGGTAISNFTVAGGSAITAGDYGDITITNTAGTSTLSGNTSFTGTLTIGASTTNATRVGLSTFTLTVGGRGIGGTAGTMSVNGSSGAPFTTGSGGTVAFLGAGLISGAATQASYVLFPASSLITIGGAVDFGNVGTTTPSGLAGTLQINPNGSINTNPPTYNSGSTLVYNTEGTYSAGAEWTTNSTSAKGVPQAVTIQNNTAVNFGSSAAYRQANGLVTIGSGSSLTLSSASGGDLRIAAGLTNSNTGTGVGINTNGRAIQTMGAGNYTKTGTDNLDYLIIGSANTLTLATGTNLSLTNTGAAGCLQFTAAGSIFMGGTNTVSIVAGGTVGGSTAGSIGGSGPTTSILSLAGTTTWNPGGVVTVTTNVGLQVNAGLTISTAGRLSVGYLQINQGGFIGGANPVVYPASSTLVYNHSSGTYGVQALEFPTASGPVNLTINANGGTGITFATNNITARILTGTLTLNHNLVLSGSGPAALTTLNTIANSTATVSGTGNFTHSASGSFTTANATGINGTLTTSGSISLPTTTSFTFNASVAQVTGSLLPTTVNNLNFSNTFSGSIATPSVTLSSSVTTTGTITFAGGVSPLGVVAIGASNTLTINGPVTIPNSQKLIGSSTSNLIIGGSGAFSTALGLFLSGAGALNNFTMNRTGVTITIGQPLTVSGTYTSTAGVIAMGSSTLTLNGPIAFGAATLTATGPFAVGGSGTITGSLLGTANPLAFTGITMNRSGAILTLGSNVTVSNTTGLTLTAGHISLGTFNLTSTSATGRLGLGRTASHIIATSSGQAFNTIPTSGFIAQTFPIGDGTNYTPVSLVFTANAVSGTVGVKTVASTHPSINSGTTASTSISRYWTFTNTLPSNYTYTSDFTYISPDDVFGTEANLELSRWNGGGWTEFPISFLTGSMLTSPILTQGTGPLNNDYTGRTNPSGITLSEISAIPASTIGVGGTNIIYNFQLAVTTAAPTLTEVTFPNTGSYSNTDFTNFKLWYNTSNSFSSANTIGTISSPSNTATQTFSSLSQLVSIGTGFFWITADIPLGATQGNTITITPSLAFSNLTFSGSTSNTLGTINATGALTIGVTSTLTDAYRSFTSGNWNSISTWESFSNGSWMAATLTPDANAGAITVLNTHTVTIPNGQSITADDITVSTSGQILVASGGTLTIANGTAVSDLNIYGTVKNAGTFTLTGTMQVFSQGVYDLAIDGTTMPPVANITWNTGSTLKISGTYSTAANTVIGNLYGNAVVNIKNVLIDCSMTNAGAFLSLSDGTLGIDTLTIANTTNGAVIPLNRAGNTTTCNTYIQTGGVMYCNNNSGNNFFTLTVTGNVHVTGGTLSLKNGSGIGGGIFNVGGNLTIGASGTLTSSSSAGFPNLNFNGSSPQIWSNPGTFSATSTSGNRITVTGTGGVTLNDDIIIGNTGLLNLTNGDFVIASGKILTLSGTTTSTISSGRTFTINGTLRRISAGLFTTTGTLSIGSLGRYIHAQSGGTVPTATWATGSVCEIGGAGVTVSSAPGGVAQSFHHFYWNPGTHNGIINFAGALSGATINGDFDIQNTSGNELRLTGNTALTLNIGGNLLVSAINGDAMLNLCTGTGLPLLTVTGNVSIGTAGTLLSSTAITGLRVAGDWINSGIFTNANTLIEFNGTASQTITKALGETFNNFTLNKASGTFGLVNDIQVNNIASLTAGTLSINSNTLTLNGTVTGSGFLRGSSTSNLSIGGTGALGTLNFDQSTDGTTNVLNNFTLNKTGGGTATLGNKLVVLDLYTPTAGTLTTNNFLHLRSTPSNTARIAEGASGGGYITGNVTVERYLSANTNRAYRLLTPGVTTATNIRTNWQEGTNNPDASTNNVGTTDYGTHITGSGGNSNGFDVTQTNAASTFLFDQAAQSWVALSNTNVNTLDAKTGYLIFVRGNRNSIATINTATGSSNTTLRATGTLAQGTQTFTNLASDIAGGNQEVSLVTNPFASPISWTNAYTAGSNTTNFENYATIWSPNIGTRGGFVTITDGGTISPSGSHNLTTNLQSGQAFFLTTKSGITNPSFTLVEANKSTTNNLDVYRTNGRTGPQTEQININLKYVNAGIAREADGVVAMFSNSYSNGLDGNDATQIANWDEDVALIRNGKELSIETRDLIDANDSLFIKIANVNKTAAIYTWEISPTNFNAPGLQAFLIDKFTNTTTPISLLDTTRVNFTVSSNTASQIADRFTIVFKLTGVLPVTITELKAVQKNAKVSVNFTTVNEINIDHYIVEKSTDALQFTNLQQLRANGGNGYTSEDGNPINGANYYRVKIVEQTGRSYYSNIVKIVIGKTGTDNFVIYPNPIKGKQFTIQLTNKNQGTYSLQLIGTNGQTVLTKIIQHSGGSLTLSVPLPNHLSKGTYQLQLSDDAGNKQVQQLIKE